MFSRFFIIILINATGSDEVIALQRKSNSITFRYLVSGCLKMRVTWFYWTFLFSLFCNLECHTNRIYWPKLLSNIGMTLRRVGWHHYQSNQPRIRRRRRRLHIKQLKRFICELCKSKVQTILWICASISGFLNFSLLFFCAMQIPLSFDIPFVCCFSIAYFWWIFCFFTKWLDVSFLSIFLFEEKKMQCSKCPYLFERSISLSLLRTAYEKWLNTPIRFIGFRIFFRHVAWEKECIVYGILVDTIIAPAAII